jgi:hypothetical protein
MPNNCVDAPAGSDGSIECLTGHLLNRVKNWETTRSEGGGSFTQVGDAEITPEEASEIARLSKQRAEKHS